MGSKFSMFVLVGAALVAQSVTGNVARAASPADGKIELTLFAGLSTPVKNETSGFGLEIETGRPVGGRALYNFSDHHAAEFSVANPLSASVNYVYHFSSLQDRWIPYVTAGIGAARRELTLTNNNEPAQLNTNLMEAGPDRSQTAFTGNFGGGLKFFFTHNFALRFDLRDEVGKYKGTFSNVVGVPGGIVRARKTLNDFQTTGGIVFRFGRT